MTTPTPAEELRAGAVRARKIGDSLYTALAAWLDAAAVGYDATVTGAAGVWSDPADAAERDAWVARQTDQHALAVARQVLGTPTTDTAPADRLREVWAVWREDEPIWAHFATVDDARQGTIDFWQEDEPACPDYSWDRQADGKRLELLVGGTHSGVYASRYRVHGAPASAPAAPADRATVLREAADIAETLRQFEPAYGPRKDAQVSENVGVLRVADHFRRLADEAQPETEGFREWLRRQPVGDQPITLMAPVPLTLAPDATAATEEPQP